MSQPYTPDRRAFLRRSLAATLGGASLYSAPGTLRLLQAAALDKGAVADFKALVCVFQYGGNDGFNTVVPIDGQARTNYFYGRGATLAIDSGLLLPLTPPAGAPGPDDGGNYGLFRASAPDQPAATQPLYDLFQQGRVAVVANVGALRQPTTRQDLDNPGFDLPPQLYSHNDQQAYWQTCRADASRGWGGRMADLLLSANDDPALPMSYSVAGESILLRAAQAQPYAINAWPRAAEALTFLEPPEAGSAQRRAVFDQLIAASAQAHILERSYAATMRRTFGNYTALQDALAAAPPVTTAFPATLLGRQLEMVAHLIAARGELGMRRMVFYVVQGGYDTHDSQSEDHPALLAGLAAAVGAFHAATVELGVADAVTTFTASDFGRTLSSNGDGSDHGWGSHHLVVGGAVRGGFYGHMPDLSADGPLDAGWGQIIPTTSVEQYAATMGRWMGLNPAQLLDVFPSLANFPAAGHDLGFLG